MIMKTKPWEEVRAKLPNTTEFQAIVELERQQALAEIVAWESAVRIHLEGIKSPYPDPRWEDSPAPTK